jgi:xanthine/CO dehydrogenase XdhC/CoxF family maturation factor
MSHALEAPLAPLVRDFRELRSQGDAFVLATVVSTAGSTYRKSGTQMLITARSQLRGLLSGGCLEVDLVLHAHDVLATGTARVASYDMRGDEDLLFGIGSGCEGAMQVLLQRVGPAEAWQPLAAVADCVRERRVGSLGLVVSGPAAGRGWWDGGGDAPWPEPEPVRDARALLASAAVAGLVECGAGGESIDVLILPLRPPPELLLCGAGADAVPLARHAVALGFAVTVCDHRPALAVPERFPHCELHCQPPGEFAALPDLSRCDAAIVMSHHLQADLAYLAAVASQPGIAYVGLLGPPARRERLLGELGPQAAALRGRLRAPLGLDIGARTPEAIALAAAGELHAWMAGRGGGPWRGTLPAAPR